MATKRRSFSRLSQERRFRKLFVIATEGEKTEPQYFGMFNNLCSVISIKCLTSSGDNSPDKVLKRMRKYIRDFELMSTDEAWIVVDKDQWNDDQLSELYNWTLSSDNYGLALSNPKFEYWLLLHFEDGKRIKSPLDCDNRLKKYIKHYNKKLNFHIFNIEQINQAIERAKSKDNPPCSDWPRTIGSTTVYRLVERIVNCK